jgi:hypothetical protein
MLKRNTREFELEAAKVIVGDICVFRFPVRDERRVVRGTYVGVVDGQEYIKVVYMDGSDATYANWVKLLVEARN